MRRFPLFYITTHTNGTFSAYIVININWWLYEKPVKKLLPDPENATEALHDHWLAGAAVESVNRGWGATHRGSTYENRCKSTWKSKVAVNRLCKMKSEFLQWPLKACSKNESASINLPVKMVQFYSIK